MARSKKSLRPAGPLAFAAALHNWRLNCGKKAEAAAREFGVAPATWSHWENSRRFPTGRNLLLLAQFIGTTVPCLVCGENALCKKVPPCDAKSPGAT